jgi:hypothetical protein
MLPADSRIEVQRHLCDLGIEMAMKEGRPGLLLNFLDTPRIERKIERAGVIAAAVIEAVDVMRLRIAEALEIRIQRGRAVDEQFRHQRLGAGEARYEIGRADRPLLQGCRKDNS